jgi:hypothetical protein
MLVSFAYYLHVRVHARAPAYATVGPYSSEEDAKAAAELTGIEFYSVERRRAA